MPGLKKCYYEVIGVERNAADDEIKKAFRKLALQLHPDKNPDRADEAKAEFQILQQAYEVLSNPQERAWYDKHRQAVLREGVDPDFDDFNIDIMAYCTSTCYSGFGDDEGCFYFVYRELFAKLAAEELEAGWGDDHDEDIPSFGDSQSLFEDVVGPFYAFWESFCTLKTFTWIDKYDTRRAGCRRIARLMDKENKKIRTDARKSWNREVRALVDFVKRKDKRVQAWKVTQEAKLKEKEAELAKKADEAKAQRLAERKKLLDSAKSHKAHPENQQLLKEMEQWMSNEFGEHISDKDSDEEDPTCFHCAACNKSFRSEKAFSNHEKSKKHLTQIQILREMMEKEDNIFLGSHSSQEEDDAKESEIEENDVEEIEEEDENENEEEIENEEEVEDEDKDIEGILENITDTNDKEKMKFDNVDSNLEEATNHLETLDVEDHTKESDHENADELFEQELLARAANRSKKGRRRQISINDDPVNELLDSDCDNPVINLDSSEDEKAKEKAEKKKKRKAKKQVVKSLKSVNESVAQIQPQVEANEALPPGPAQCVVCKIEFSSRTQMFRHIKSTGHAAPLDTINTMKAAAAVDAGKSSNKKRKSKHRE